MAKAAKKVKSSDSLSSLDNAVPVVLPVAQPPKELDLSVRTPTGIPGFDSLIEGGFPKGSKILVEGKAGTGKSIFAMQFLYEGVMRYKEPGIYLSFEQKDVDIKKQAKQFGWDFDAAGIEVIYKSPSKVKSVQEILEILYTKFRRNGAGRLVIDSLPALYINAIGVAAAKESNSKFFNRKEKEEKLEPKTFLYLLLDMLKFVPVTTILVTEEIEQNANEMGFTPEYISDGVIKISLEPIGDYARNMVIKKMRYTKNVSSLQYVEINDKGISVHPIS